jgi:hypothetical protein
LPDLISKGGVRAPAERWRAYSDELKNKRVAGFFSDCKVNSPLSREKMPCDANQLDIEYGVGDTCLKYIWSGSPSGGDHR